MAWRLFQWQVLRYIAQHRLLALLNVASVALGVAVYLAIQIANHSANRAFAASIDLVAGKAHLQVTAPTGTLRDEVLPLAARQPGIVAATPLVRGLLTLPQFPGEYLDLIGVDVFTDEAFRTFELTNFHGEDFDLPRWLGGADTIAISEEFARAHHLQTGSPLDVQVNGKAKRLTIGFVVRMTGSLAGDPHLAAMDLGWAQELLGRRGFLDAIELRVESPGRAAQVAARLRELLPPDAIVAAPAQRGEQVQKMLAGFELNLAAMSLVSLLVGMFLINNTISASVVRRRSEIGILRSLGATRATVRWLFLGEAIVLGTFGIALGLLAGVFLAKALIGTVSATISSLYVLLSVRELSISPWIWLSAILLGFASVLAAAWLPARAAARMDPVRALHAGEMIERAASLSSGWLVCAITSLLLAALLSFLALRTGPAWLGFGSAFFVLTGFSLLAPHATARFSRAMSGLLRASRGNFPLPRLAAENLSRSLMRNSVTIAALAASVAMTVGVAVMVFSFRQTVAAWVEQTLIADLFIAPASNEIVGPTSFMPPETIRFLETDPAIEAVDTFRETQLPFRGRTIDLGVVRGSNRRNLRFLHGSNDPIMRRFYRERCVLISESFSRRFRVREGEEITLPTPAGAQQFPVAGIFYDYTRDQGIIFLSAANFRQFWNDDRVTSVAVYLKGGSSADALAARFRQRFSVQGEFAIYSNRLLRSRIFEIFDQTFAVTYVLRTIAIVVAVAGIFFTLTTLVTERSRELAVLRAIGASAAQIRRLLLWESAMLGVLASGIGLAAGLCLALVLTGVINRAFFGWTIQLAFPWRSLAWTPLWIIGAAIVAGWLPAARAGRLVIADAVRSE
jgi:putative ABC transport system permease protein